jgi:hypothetical protein
VIFHGEKLVDEGPAHVVDFIYKIGAQSEIAAVIMHAVNAIVARLLMAAAREYVDLMPAAVQRCRQFRDVNTDSSHGNAVQCLPRKQSDLHI